MNLADLMDEVGGRLDEIRGLRVFPFWADRITPPAAVVGWPDPLDYDATMGRGSDRITLPVTVLVGKVDARSSRDDLARFVDGAGADSVKARLDGTDYTACDSARVSRCEFAVITVAGVEYLAATFDCDLIGKGA